jgi:ubiquinone/menaquinone biosynthesis C-methylase UbiE
VTAWDARASAYRASADHSEGADLDLVVAWCEPGEGVTALDVATGGGHVARRLREAGCTVTTLDPSPGMQPDVIARAEDIPFADDSFDVVVTRIAPHHFVDVERAVSEMARVARDRVVIEDTLYASEDVEIAERLRDPTHVRSYTEGEWRRFLEHAGLAVDEVESCAKAHPLDEWLARTECTGDDAVEVRRLLADRTDDDGFWHDIKIILKARKQ